MVGPLATRLQIDTDSIVLIADELVMNAAGFSAEIDDSNQAPTVPAVSRYATTLILGRTSTGLAIGVGDTEKGWSSTPGRPGTQDPQPETIEKRNLLPLPRAALEEATNKLGTTGRGLDITRALAEAVCWSKRLDGKMIWAIMGSPQRRSIILPSVWWTHRHKSGIINPLRTT